MDFLGRREDVVARACTKWFGKAIVMQLVWGVQCA